MATTVEEEIKKAIEERVNRLPDAVRTCEICGGEMQIRNSSLNLDAYADDVTMKCSECRVIRTHGIPFQTEGAFEKALARRRRASFSDDKARYKTWDLASNDGDGTDPTAERLEALGYIGRAQALKDPEY